MTDLGTLGGAQSGASDINSNGQIVGVADTGTGDSHAFSTFGSTMVDLGTLGGSFSDAISINNLGQIVGVSTVIGENNHAFYYINGSMYDLNDLTLNASGWVLESAQAINNLGQIVGSGQLNGIQTAFLLSPIVIPEPSSWAAMAGIGAACLAFVLRGRRHREILK